MLDIEPKIYTLIPCGEKHGPYVREAISGILKQTRKPDLLILIDDGPSKLTQKIYEEYRQNRDVPVRVIVHNAPEGHIKSYNEGIAIAQEESADYFHLMAADDLLVNRRFYRQALNLFGENNLGYVSAASAAVGYDGQLLDKRVPPFSGVVKPKKVLEAMYERGNFTCGGCTLVNMDAQTYYLPELPFTADYMMWIKILADQWKVAYIPEISYGYRQSITQMTHFSRGSKVERDICQKALEDALGYEA